MSARQKNVLKAGVETGKGAGKLRILLDLDGEILLVDSGKPRHISIPLGFEGGRPEVFGLPAPTASIVRNGAFVGSVAEGGSCNCLTVTFSPHGGGTHTEGAGHLTAESRPVHEALTDSWVPATLISVPAKAPIAAADLEAALAPADPRFLAGLVVRTLPNPPEKRKRQWTSSGAAYFDRAAIEFLVRLGVRHLVTDLPSVDARDDPVLEAHRAFFGYDAQQVSCAGSRESVARPGASITELAFIPDDIRDGRYLLELQIAPFILDAAPSRPILFEVSPL